MFRNIWLHSRLLASAYYVLNYAYDYRRYCDYRDRYEIAPSFQFRGERNEVSGMGRIVLGENSYMSSYCILYSAADCIIKVGANTAIGPYVKMYTENRIFEQDLNVPQLTTPIKKKKGDITIGNGCWIGANVGIVGGVRIGDNSVIGMNSVVTHSIPDNSLAVGCPATVKKIKCI